MVDNDALTIIEYDKLCQVLDFKYKSIYAFKNNLAIQLVARSEYKDKDVVLNVRLDLSRETYLY